MTEQHNPDKKSRNGFGIIMFGLGAGFGILATLACIAVIFVLGIFPARSVTTQDDTTGAAFDGWVKLELGEDGCHAFRGEVEGSNPGSSLTWVIKDLEGYTLLERNARGEYDTKFFRGGQYQVYLKAWHNGQYHQISEEIVVDCPQGP